MHEFKPEQVKRYLAREVIGGLPNAAAIDLSQFAGLFDADAARVAEEEAEGGEYRELLDALRTKPTAPALPGYEVSVLGRWVELDATSRATVPSPARVVRAPCPARRSSGQRCEFDVEDGGGRRRVVLHGVVPGRRYVVGNGEGCGHPRRRHLRQPSPCRDLARERRLVGRRRRLDQRHARRAGRAAAARRRRRRRRWASTPMRLANGLRIVLSARAEGPASEYPWLALAAGAGQRLDGHADRHRERHAAHAAHRDPGGAGAPDLATPTTQILPAARDESAFRLTLSHAAGVRTLPLTPALLPVSVGRSRHQTLVVDRRHEGVSGHHLDIVEIDPAGGCVVVVHGDNGVTIDGVRARRRRPRALAAGPDDGARRRLAGGGALRARAGAGRTASD